MVLMVEMPERTKNIYLTMINYYINIYNGRIIYKKDSSIEEEFPSGWESNLPCDYFIIKYWEHK